MLMILLLDLARTDDSIIKIRTVSKREIGGSDTIFKFAKCL